MKLEFPSLLAESSFGNVILVPSFPLFISCSSGNTMEESLLKFGEKPSLDTMAFKSGKTPILSEAGSLDFVPVLGSLKISLSWLGVYTFPD